MSQTIEQKLATAIAAANEFKLMLDMQRPGTLFYPGRKKIDPRQSACYQKAAQDLFDLTETPQITETKDHVEQLRKQITALRTEIIEAHLLALGSDKIVVSPQRVEELQLRMVKARSDIAQLQLLAMSEFRYRQAYATHSTGFLLSELCQRDSAPSSANTDITSIEVGSRSNKS